MMNADGQWDQAQMKSPAYGPNLQKVMNSQSQYGMPSGLQNALFSGVDPKIQSFLGPALAALLRGR